MQKISNEDLGRPTPETFAEMPKLNIAVVLDNVRSMNNIGSFFRTCDAFAMERIMLCGITATPPNKEIHKTALGAENTVRWDYYEKTSYAVELLKKDGYIVVAIEQVENAIMLSDFNPNPSSKYALVFGNEVFGVAQDVVDMCEMSIEIPQTGTKHSLNVSVSAGVVLWAFYNSLQFGK